MNITRRILPLLTPLLLSAYPVLFLYGENAEGMPLWVIARPLVVSLLGALVVVMILGALFRSVTPVVFLSSSFLLLFFSYGHLWLVLTKLLPVNLYPYGWHWVLMPVWFSLLTAAILITRCLRRMLGTANRFLAGFAVVLVGMAALNGSLYELNGRGDYDPTGLDEISVEEVNAQRPEQTPDVYYIIFDEYARADVLREEFGYDVSPFLDYLTSRGFYIASESRANYPQTPLSLTSSLNMQHLDSLVEGIGRDSTDTTALYPYLENPILVQIFKDMGYRYVHVSSGWVPTSNQPLADVSTYRPEDLLYFEELLGLSTWLNPGIPFVVRHQSRERTLSGLEAVRRVPELDGPTFVFAHFMMPHFPFVFQTEDGPSLPGGSSVDGIVVDADAYGPNAPYLQQVGFTNRVAATLVDDILAASEVPPIIVMQSDHGYRFVGSPREEALGPSGFDELVVPILNAYYLPRHGSDALYRSITPVNSFRLILDTYFGTHLNLLPDRSFYADRMLLYDLVELPPRQEP